MSQASTSTNRTKGRNGASAAKKDDIGAEIEALRDEVKAVTERLGRIAGVGIDEARSKGDASAIALQETSNQLINDLTTQLNEIERKTGTAVRNNPLQALGIAAGIGFLAALVMRR